MSSKPKKNQGKSDNEPKRYIVIPGKRKIIGVEDISDESEDFDHFGDRLPFSADVDPSILLPMLTPASCYPKRTLLTYAAITIKGHS